MERGTHQRITIENHVATVEQTGFQTKSYDLRDTAGRLDFQSRTDFFGLGVLALSELYRENPNNPVIILLQNALLNASTGMGLNIEGIPEQFLNALASQEERIEFTL